MAESSVLSVTKNSDRAATDDPTESRRPDIDRSGPPVRFVRWPAGNLTDLVDSYYEFLQRGLRVNRAFAHAWFAAMTGEFDSGRAPITAVADALGGHGEAIESWLDDEAKLVKRSMNLSVGSRR
ncbi:MAG TPA: hypothetical protein VIU87_27100 [Mycobacterium sp.]